jgi:hypothetical protein
LLYEFIEDQFNRSKANHKSKEVVSASEKKKKQIEKNNKNEKSKERGNQTIIPKALHFYEWATYLKTNQTFVKTSNIENKFELINSFLAKQQKIIPDKSKLIMKT